jgi:hypothetical protein
MRNFSRECLFWISRVLVRVNNSTRKTSRKLNSYSGRLRLWSYWNFARKSYFRMLFRREQR